MVNAVPTRDLIGYADAPPLVQWPGGARVAVNFVINYEEGGELNVLEGDATSEARISDVAVTSRMGERDLNIESSYEYGARVGYWRLLRTFADRGLTATVNLVGRAGEMNPVALRAMIDAGMDIQLHGWRWLDFSQVPEDQERAMIARAVQQVVDLTGQAPIGYYAGMPSMHTRRLVVEHGGFLYDSDVYNDDLPYWSPDHPGHLLVPYSLDTNDSRFSRSNGGYQVADEFATYLRDTFDTLHAEGATRPQMMTVGLHARLIGRPGRIVSLYRFLDHIAARGGAWVCRRGDLARHWAAAHPDPRT
jgi:allantoinase